jgi:hypothetical protein
MKLRRAASFVIALIAARVPVVAQIRFGTVNSEIVEQRLKSYKGNDSEREATVKLLFQSAGCPEDKLTEQPVKGLKQGNVICTLPGNTDSVIVVGAHFDHVDAGDGVVDNWSGASMLPSLYQVVKPNRVNTLLFLWPSPAKKKVLWVPDSTWTVLRPSK